MRQVLCIFTGSGDALAEEVILAERERGDCDVSVIDLSGAPDYDKLLDAILVADSVQVW